MEEFASHTSARIDAVRRAVGQADAELLVATDHATVRWISGRSIQAGTIAVVSSHAAALLGPGDDQLDALRVAAPFAKRGRMTPLAIETPAAPAWLLGELAGHPLVDLGQKLEQLRIVKDPAELALLAEAAVRATAAQRIFRSEISLGISEQTVSDRVQSRLVQQQKPTAAIVDLMFGERCALVGAAPTSRTLAAGETALFDFAPIVDDYWGDSCSTVVLGTPASEVSRLHGAVARALRAGIDLLRPGVRASAVDAAVRSVMAEAGYHYPHFTGHGVGLKQQEPPYISPDSQHILAAGTVVALEPGAYFDGYGVRLEHVIQITEDAPRVLTGHDLALGAG